MLKLCSCFKGNNNKSNKRKTNIDLKLNENKFIDLNLFLTGDDESGRTKLIEELCYLDDPFTRKDKILKTCEIEEYIRYSLINIINAFKENNSSNSLEYPENDQIINYILKTSQRNNFDYPLEFFEYIQILWSDVGLQSFINNSKNQQFSDSSKYFLNRINQIENPDYIPSTEDMIQSRLFPSSIFKSSFKIEEDKFYLNLFEMNLFDEKHEELIELFNNKKSIIIIFIIDSSSFDKLINKNSNETQLHQSINLYKIIQNNKLLKTKQCILLFNKENILKDKIQNGIQIEEFFPDFKDYFIDTNSINSFEDLQVLRVKSFIEHQFLKFNNNNNTYHKFLCDNDISIRLINEYYSKINL